MGCVYVCVSYHKIEDNKQTQHACKLLQSQRCQKLVQYAIILTILCAWLWTPLLFSKRRKKRFFFKISPIDMKQYTELNWTKNHYKLNSNQDVCFDWFKARLICSSKQKNNSTKSLWKIFCLHYGLKIKTIP